MCVLKVIVFLAVLAVFAVINHDFFGISYQGSAIGFAFFTAIKVIPNLVSVNFQKAILGVLAIAIPASIYLMV